MKVVILAAWLASRYGSSKQMEWFWPHGETILQYSVFDAMKAGFNQFVFIIKPEFETAFKEIVDTTLPATISIEYVFQTMDSLLDGYTYLPERIKPRGTWHALLCARNVLNVPFVVINADDFYGRDAFVKAYDFLATECTETTYGSIAYLLKNTLSENGSVNRGICVTDKDGYLESITERTDITLTNNRISVQDDKQPLVLSPDDIVSMNFFCCHPTIFDLWERLFKQFLQDNGQQLKSEFYLPTIIDTFAHTIGKVKVIKNDSRRFGVTYKEDAEGVRKELYQLTIQGEYPSPLYR